ncbi:MAG: hypothetical protein R2838_17225 [Caldilineaceae bacterium]
MGGLDGWCASDLKSASTAEALLTAVAARATRPTASTHNILDYMYGVLLPIEI